MTGHRRILIVTIPFQGNVIPCTRFANRLIKMGADVTFCTSLSIIRRMDNQTTVHGLNFAPFSDSHDGGMQPPTTLQQYVSDFSTYCAHALPEIIRSAVTSGQPFDHLVYTIMVPWVARVADAHGVKSSLLWCQSATLLDVYYYYFNGECQEDTLTFPINLPGLPPLTTVDCPSFILPSSPKEHDFVLPFLKDHIDVLKITSRILVNTFNELEVEYVKAIEKLRFLSIGPLIPSEILDTDFFNDMEDDYIRWLNTKPKSSVVYVSFGSIANLPIDQLEEIANGLLESRRPFLWVIRDSEQAGRLSKMEELKRHGMIVSWCSQAMVLNHQAIGCFLMHSGWNSTVETLVAGVPAVVLPQWSDQGTNAKMMEDVWRIGVRFWRREGDEKVEGKEIKRCVEMVMGDDDMKRNAQKWRDLAREALSDGGSSTLNLRAFLNEI